MATYSASGLTISTQEEILAQIEAAQRADIDADLDLSTSSAEGQINRIFARRLRLLEEALLALSGAWDADNTTGDALFRLGALTGTYRRGATSSRVTASVTLAAGMYPAGAIEAYPPARPDALFRSVDPITTAGGVVSVPLVCVVTGPISALADTLVIVPVAGVSALTHPDADIGTDIESEEAFRARRLAEVDSQGSATSGGIRADLSRDVPLLESIRIVANNEEIAVGGIPPHAVEAIVFGPSSPTLADDEMVAQSLLGSVAAGIGTHGTTSVDVVDDEGVTHTMRFTRPVDLPTSVWVSFIRAAKGYAGDLTVLDRIASIDLPPGWDVAWGAIASAVMSVPGVLRIVSITIDALPPMTNKPVALRERATISTGDITLLSSIGEP